MAVTIDAAWLADAENGGPNGPYTLQANNETWTLATNVTTPGPAFILKSSTKSKFDLNGFTITYDNEWESGIATSLANWDFNDGNGSVGSGSTAGWDLTNAPNASLVTGSYNGSVLGSLRAPNPGWYSMNFNHSAPGTEYIETTGNVTLLNGEAYWLGFWVNDQGWDGNPGFLVTLEIVGTTISTSFGNGGTQNTSRVDQLRGEYFEITGGNKTGKVRLTVQKFAGFEGNLCVGTIVIRGANRHGVVCPASTSRSADWGGYPYVGTSAASNNCTITNGTITQGAGQSVTSYPLSWECSGGSTVSDLTCTSNGWMDCAAGFFRWAKSVTVSGCTFDWDNLEAYVSNRDKSYGYVVWKRAEGDGCTFTDCIIQGGVQGGITFSAGGPETGVCTLTNLTIRLLGAKYTNGFALQIEGTAQAGSYVGGTDANNLLTIDTYQGGDTTYGARGLHLADCRNYTFGFIESKDKSRKTAQITSVHWGVQFEENVKNNIWGKTTGGAAAPCVIESHAVEMDAAALRIKLRPNFLPSAANEIHNTTFIAIADDFKRYATGIESDGHLNLSAGVLTFGDNVEVQTNSVWIVAGDLNKEFIWEGIRFTELLPRDNDPIPVAPETVACFVKSTRYSTTFNGLKLLDSIFTTTSVRDQFDVMRWHRGRESNPPDTTDSMEVSFTTTFAAGGGAGQLVEVKLANTSTVITSGSTDSSGEVELEVDRIVYANGAPTVRVYDVTVDTVLRLEDWTPEEKTTTSNPVDISTGGVNQTIVIPTENISITTVNPIIQVAEGSQTIVIPVEEIDVITHEAVLFSQNPVSRVYTSRAKLRLMRRLQD